jgi:tetratricopeptide (TPR) repeat protein
MNARLLLFALGAALAGTALAPARSLAQAVDPPGGTPAERGQREREALGDARAAQSRFEIARAQWLPRTAGWSGGDCDERIGRMCLRHDEGDWWPGPEDARIVAAREGLLAQLAAAHALAPAEPWILGQRVLYLGEAGRWEAADSLARAVCAERPAPWCHALSGLALHALGRFPDAERAFRAALDRMEPDSASAWLDPERLLDARARSWLDDAPPSDRGRRIAEVWALADPLLLVPGNDQLTEHLSRVTLARARASARNPYGMTWSRDLEEMLVRFGWEAGWERIDERSVDPARADPVVGHHAPDSRPLMPTGAVLEDPPAAPASAWIGEFRRPRATYAPGYASAVLPADAQLAVFPRGGRFAVIAAVALPDDTTGRARDAPEQRRAPRTPWRDLEAEAGLFVIPAGGGPPLEARSRGSSGALILEVPAGRSVVSVETWDPSVRRAGRTRAGLDLRARAPGEPTLSDLLLVDGGVAEGISLEDAAPRALPRAWVREGERVGIVWELFGFSTAEDPLSYRLTLEPRRPGLLQRAGRALRLLRTAPGRLLEWQEAAPDAPEPSLRGVELDLSELERGFWMIRLEVRPRGRAPLTVERQIEVRRASQG